MSIRRFSTILLLFFFCIKGIGQSQKELFFSDYSTNDVVENVYILSRSGQFLAISNEIYAALLSWTGKWINGEGDTNSLFRVISYAMLPGIASLLLLVPEIAMFGNEIFQKDIDI